MKTEKYLEHIVTGHPRLIILLFLTVTALFAFFLPQLQQDTNPFLLQPTHESRIFWEKTKDTYTGLKGNTYVLLEATDTVFKAETLERIHRLTEAFLEIQLIEEEDFELLKKMAAKINGEAKSRLEELLVLGLGSDNWQELESVKELIEQSGQMTPDINDVFTQIFVRLTPVIDVMSLSNTDNIIGVDGGLDIEPIYENVPENADEIEMIKKQVSTNDLFKEVLTIKNGKYSSIIIETAINDDDTKTKYLMYLKLLDILQNKVPGNEKFYIAGIPVFSATLSHTMKTDTTRLFPIVFLFVIFGLWLSFRMLKGIIVPLFVVLLSLILTISLKAVFNIPLNIISTSIPVFILSIGVADGIHIYSEFRDYITEGLNKVDAVRRTMRELTSPVIMTSLTTAVAFMALSVTEIMQIKHFGIFVAIGTLIAMVFSLVFIPALLIVLPQSVIKEKKNITWLDRFIHKGLVKVSRFTISNPKPILFVSLMIGIIAFYGLSLIKVENNPIDYFKKDSELVISTNKIDSTASGSSVLNILVEALETDDEPLKKPENLQAIEDLSQYLEQQQLVGKVLGLSQLIRRINLTLHDEDPLFNRIPHTIEKIDTTPSETRLNSQRSDKGEETIYGRQMISQYLLLYENSGGDVLSDAVDSRYRHANVQAMIRSNSSSEIARLTEDIKKYIAVNFPKNLNVTFTGTAHLSAVANREIVNGQINSLVLSLLMTLFLLVLMFRSILTGMFAVIPLLATALINFGVMGFMGVPLDIGTAIISSIVIGVGVDYSIHYLNRLQNNIKKGLPFQNAIAHTVKHSGKAIVLNAFTVGTGFVALLFSVVTPLVTIGWMVILTMIISSFSTIVLLPALFSIFQNATIHKWNKNNLVKYQFDPETT